MDVRKLALKYPVAGTRGLNNLQNLGAYRHTVSNRILSMFTRYGPPTTLNL